MCEAGTFARLHQEHDTPMSVRDRSPLESGVDCAQQVEFRPLSIDDMSNLRYIHTASMRLHAAHVLSEDELATFCDHVYSESYANALSRVRLIGAIMGDELIGTAGWSLGDDSGSGVRITGLHVRPLFTRMGVGTALLRAVETAARAGGFDTFSTRATHNAVAFFEARGYVVTSYGVYQTGGAHGLPVAFMRKVDGPVPEPVDPEPRQLSPVTIN